MGGGDGDLGSGDGDLADAFFFFLASCARVKTAGGGGAGAGSRKGVGVGERGSWRAQKANVLLAAVLSLGTGQCTGQCHVGVLARQAVPTNTMS